MNRTEVRGLAVVQSDYPEVIRAVADDVSGGSERGFAVFFEGNLLYSLLSAPDLGSVLSQARYVFPDGTAVAQAATMRSRRPTCRLSGPTFILKACDKGRRYHWRHFLYGGADGVAEKLAEKLRNLYPGVEIVGCYSPPYRKLKNGKIQVEPAEDAAEVALINAAKPDLVWVGLGGPKQEYWMQAHLGRIDATLMLGVGAAFDFHSGVRPWAPPWVRKCGLEWLYRMLKGGRATLKRNLKCVPCAMLFVAGCFIKYKLFRKSP